MIVNQNNFNDIKKKIESKNNEFEVISIIYKDIKNNGKIRKRIYLKIKHKTCGNIFETPAHKINNDNPKINCNKCVFKKKDYLTFETEFKNTANNEYVLLSKYEKVSKKVKVKHLTCGHEYEVTPNKWLSGRRCPKCYGPKKLTNSEFEEKFNKTSEGEYLLLSPYISTHIKVKVKHLTCGHEYEVTPNKWLSGRRCPRCRSSKGEKEIAKYLKSINKDYATQVKYNECKDILPLPFDFGVYNLNKSDYLFLIEFDGCQHFQRRYDDLDGSKLELTKKHDSIKNEFCKNNNIPLLRIRDIKDIKDSIEKMFNDYPETE